MFKKLGLAVALAALTAGAAVAMESYTAGAVQVHEMPDAQSRVVATVADGNKVMLLRCDNEWCLITGPEVEGWVRDDELVLRGGGV